MVPVGFEPGTIRVSAAGEKPRPQGASEQPDSQTFSTEDVKIIHFTSVESEPGSPAVKLPLSHDRKVWLKGGSLVVGKVTAIDSKSVTLETGGGLTMLPRAAVAIIDMRSETVEGEWRLMLQETPAGYLLENNNFVEAKLEEMTKTGEFSTWSSIFGRKNVALSKVRAVKLASIQKAPAKEFVVTTLSGSIILADSIISKGARLIIRDNSRYFLNIRASEVVEIRRAGS